MKKTPGKVIVSEDLLLMKDMIGRPRKVKFHDSREEMLIQLKELGYKVETMEKNKKEEDKSITPKRRKQILFLLKLIQ